MSKRLQRARELLAQLQFDEAQSVCRTEIKLRRDVPAARKLLAVALYGRSVQLLAHGEFHAEVEALAGTEVAAPAQKSLLERLRGAR